MLPDLVPVSLPDYIKVVVVTYLMVPVLNEVNVFKPHAANEPIIGHRLLDTSEFIEEFGCCALHPAIKGGGASHSYLDSVCTAHDTFVVSLATSLTTI